MIRPVVRIGPKEVHLSDPENKEIIYSMSSRYAKSPVFYNALYVPHSTFGTPSNEVHKHKRAMLNPFFSRRMVLELEGVVQHKAAKIVDLMSSAIAADRPVDLHHAFRALSVDVISDYAFNKSYDLLDSPDLGAHFFAMARGVGPAMYVFQQFPSLQRLAMKIPPWLAPMLSRPLGYVVGMQMEGVKQIEDVRTRMESGKLGTARPTIFSELLDPEKQDGWPMPSTMELKDDVYSLLVAAADTTGNAMTRAAFHVINDQQAYSKLRSELLAAFPDPRAKQDFVTLERLPYLTAVIKEALRLSLGVIGRLPRVVPEGSAKFNGYFVPAGTIVGMSSWLMHLNSDVFPNPTKFNPERWLDPVEL
ncbi:hypothetical protein H2201_007516 [Coniosporium apollinis]|uniref:Cytochrome P450 n=1 Tax=Coniosporium apollinis TaxID=61459 RepID=A0ABQ9NJ55_9PEZI|nr:hypothetical protein H2201_007516 [Coniosporium apollinis]